MKSWLCIGALVVAFVAAQGQAAIYLEIEGIPGEATAKGYLDWIEVDAFGIEFSSSTSIGGIGGGGAGKATASPLAIRSHVDKSSPKLFEALVMGNHIRWAQLDIVPPIGGPAVATWEFEDLFVTRYRSDATGDGQATEEYDLVFGAVTYTYNEYRNDGTPVGKVVANWDLANNTTSVVTTGTVENFQLYTGTIPEPATAAIVAGGAVLGLLRRRR